MRREQYSAGHKEDWEPTPVDTQSAKNHKLLAFTLTSVTSIYIHTLRALPAAAVIVNPEAS